MMNYRYYIFVAFTTAIFTFAYCFSEYIKNSLEAKDWKFIPLNARDNREFGNVFVSGWLLNEHTGKLYHIGEIRFESEKSNEKPIFDLYNKLLNPSLKASSKIEDLLKKEKSEFDEFDSPAQKTPAQH